MVCTFPKNNRGIAPKDMLLILVDISHINATCYNNVVVLTKHANGLYDTSFQSEIIHHLTKISTLCVLASPSITLLIFIFKRCLSNTLYHVRSGSYTRKKKLRHDNMFFWLIIPLIALQFFLKDDRLIPRGY